MAPTANAVHLTADGVSVVVDGGPGGAVVRHWGAPLGAAADVEETLRTLGPVLAPGGVDELVPVSIVPTHGDGFAGPPGIEVVRPDGTAWAPRWTVRSVSADESQVRVESVDDEVGLRLDTTVALDPQGVVQLRAELTNEAESDLWVHRLDLALPVPAEAHELLTFTGQWSREGVSRRRPFSEGTTGTENRSGRPSHETPPITVVGAAGFGEWHGEVWAGHLAWSGNHRTAAVQLADGRRYLSAGEVLHPGEVRLAPGDSYTTPELLGSWSADGLGTASRRFHRLVRSRPHHPGPERPRPVTANTWEAVYFDLDPERLRQLADAAAAVGVERFVLDDGWFGSRRDDRSGLGDWVVSADVFPDGLHPLIDHVRDLGMEFGIWFEPEMVNEDSDLFRAHPEWVLATEGYEPVRGRGQLVLDLARPEAFDHVLGRLDAVLRDHDIAYVKWDMNRPHVQASGADGRAGTHRQTEATLRLFDELRRRHPSVEFESCASGGGRIDLDILTRAERVWTSDNTDALDRQRIQRSVSLLIPPEIMGAHISGPTVPITGRTHSLAFRGATAFFGHLGVEWNLLAADEAERDALARIITLHKRHRHLLHGGDTVRFDPTDESGLAHGVYAADRSEAIVAYARVDSRGPLAPAPLRLPGLLADAVYDIEHLRLPGERWGYALTQPEWLHRGAALTGAQLAAHGLQLPALLPETAILLRLSRRA